MNEIVDGNLAEEEQVPSENELSDFYNINRATVRKGLQLLVDKEIVYKKRGIGMFVKKGAKTKLLKERENRYNQEYIQPLLKEAERIGMNTEEVIELIKKEEQK